MKQLKHLLSALLLITTLCAQAQVGIGTATPAASAQLDVSSSTKGLLPPRMTTAQRDLIVTPAAGLIIYNTTISGLQIYSGSTWYTASAATTMGAIGGSSTTNGGTITAGVLSLTPADGGNGGIVTNGTQTIGGDKTFTQSVTANSFVKTGGVSSQYLMADGSTSPRIALGPVGGTSTSNGATLTNGTLSLAPADATNSGIITTGIQTIAGNKTLTGTLGVGTATPAATAQLDVSSSTKGFLPPRMTTTQRGAISSPSAGLIIFNSSSNALEMYTGSKWISMGSSSADPLPSIQIGTQVWQAKNLDVAFYRNGDPIPQVKNAAAWSALTTGAWCWYNNDSTNGTKYGKLYNWYAVTDARGLAPQGWHIPSDAEWTTLSSTTLGGDATAGGQMKEAGTLNWTTPNTGGNNSSGFAGLPGGYRGTNGTFSVVGSNGYWWCATEDVTAAAWYRGLYYGNGLLLRYYDYKSFGFSVRCLRD